MGWPPGQKNGHFWPFFGPGGLPMQLLSVFFYSHGPGIRLEGWLFFFRPYLSSNSNDKSRTSVFSLSIPAQDPSKTPI